MKDCQNCGICATRGITGTGSALVLMVSSVCLSGCADRFIVFTTGTCIGIEATAEEGAEQRLVLGYKRFEGAMVPTRTDKKAQRPNELTDRAYAVYAALGLTSAFFDTSVHQVFATGNAAVQLSENADGLSKAVEAGDIATWSQLEETGIRNAGDKIGRLMELAKKEWIALTADERKELGDITRFFSQYDESLHSAYHVRFK